MPARWPVLPVVLLSLAGSKQPEISSLTIGFRGRGAYSEPSLLRVTLGEGRNVHRIDGRSFRSGQDSVSGYDPTPHAGPIPVGTHGTLPIRIDLVGSTGDPLSTVHADLHLEPRYHFGVTIFAGYATRPETMCIVETYAAPMRMRPQNPSADSMFVLISGLPMDAVC